MGGFGSSGTGRLFHHRVFQGSVARFSTKFLLEMFGRRISSLRRIRHGMSFPRPLRSVEGSGSHTPSGQVLGLCTISSTGHTTVRAGQLTLSSRLEEIRLIL